MTYRFHQLLTATLNPKRALMESTPSAAMLGGIFFEAVVAQELGFEPWLPTDVTMDEATGEMYAIQASRAAEAIQEIVETGLMYQPVLAWPWAKGRWINGRETEESRAEGHPDFMTLDANHLIDLKTTEYPTEEHLSELLHSIQMCSYMAAHKRMYEKPVRLSIVLASRLVEPEPVKFNKDGSVSLSGQNAEHYALKAAVEAMGEKADDRHWKMVYNAPIWNPVMVGTLSEVECDALADVGAIFLDAGLAILDTGLSDVVCRPYS